MARKKAQYETGDDGRGSKPGLRAEAVGSRGQDALVHGDLAECKHVVLGSNLKGLEYEA